MIINLCKKTCDLTRQIANLRSDYVETVKADGLVNKNAGIIEVIEFGG